jgi:4-amino-4-deoxy-L-arabinose transferase-like glycosyltransferase
LLANSLQARSKIIVEPQPSAKHALYSYLAVLAASVFAFSFGLGRLGFLGPDEPRYAEVAREMFASGDYISTRLCGCLWFEKPALLYWLSALGYRFFGVNEFAARFPTILVAIATVAMVCAALNAYGRRGLAVGAALVLATAGIVIAYARVATPDMILTATITAALLSGFQACRSTGRARTIYWTLAFSSTGLAVLAKGLVGIVLVSLILSFWMLVTGKLRTLRWRDSLIGFVAFTIVAGSWYGPVLWRHGWSFVEEFFIRHHFQRYTSNEFGHPQPVYFFIIVAVVGLAPWTFFLIPASSRLRSVLRNDSLVTLAWVWAAIPLLFFSFSESKLPGYILPIFPALAIIVGGEIERVWNGETGRELSVAKWLTALALIGMGVGFVVFTRSESVSIDGMRAVLDALPIIAALVASVALVLHRYRIFVVSTAGVVLAIVLAAVILLFPTLYDEVSLKSLSLKAAAALRPGEKIGFYLKKEFAPVFYAEGRVLCEPRRGGTFYALHQEMVNDALQGEPSLVLITDTKWREGLENDSRFTTEFVAEQGDSLALRVSLRK